MRVFVAGATGAIGRPLVRQLREAGHEVVGTTRSEEKAERLRAEGAECVVCDALDLDALRAAVREAGPDALVNQLTDLPRNFSVRYRYGRTGDLRMRATPAMIEAGREVGARRIVAQSIAFLYVPTGDRVKDEDAPTLNSELAPGKFGQAAEETLAMERAVVEAEGMEGLVLRYGFFYGPGTWFAQGTSLAKAYRRRMSPIVGTGEGVYSFVHVEDAASATVAALERGAPGVYNVVDDEPAPANDWVPAFAEAVGGKPPRRVPMWLGKLVGGFNAQTMETMRGASNAKAKRELGWEPRYASWRQGFREGLA
ncbi:MAG: NAD(P)-dependent oxidoreductase [Actinomycetota bacterium]|nr:NAD(P)-dependent oxidoreductase [Actinomycetota bacterium]